MKKKQLIDTLGLIPHREGGYFSETYRSAVIIQTDRNPRERFLLTSIYYLLTDDRPIGYFHVNKSDIIHYFHSGSPLTYFIISPDGVLEKFTLGNDVAKGHQFQLIVKGGYWKATVLEKGEFGLLGEAVAPGFDYADMRIGTPEVLKSLFPKLWPDISAYVHPG